MTDRRSLPDSPRAGSRPDSPRAGSRPDSPRAGSRPGPSLLPPALDDRRHRAYETVYREALEALDLRGTLHYRIENDDDPTPASSALIHLARQFSLMGADGWNLAQTDDERRDLIQNALLLHRAKGTAGGLEAAMARAGYPSARVHERRPASRPRPARHDGSVRRQGEQGRPFPPYQSRNAWAYFRVTLDLTEQDRRAAAERDLRATIESYKRAACHLSGFDLHFSPPLEMVQPLEAMDLAYRFTPGEVWMGGAKHDARLRRGEAEKLRRTGTSLRRAGDEPGTSLRRAGDEPGTSLRRAGDEPGTSLRRDGIPRRRFLGPPRDGGVYPARVRFHSQLRLNESGRRRIKRTGKTLRRGDGLYDGTLPPLADGGLWFEPARHPLFPPDPPGFCASLWQETTQARHNARLRRGGIAWPRSGSFSRTGGEWRGTNLGPRGLSPPRARALPQTTRLSARLGLHERASHPTEFRRRGEILRAGEGARDGSRLLFHDAGVVLAPLPPRLGQSLSHPPPIGSF